MLGKIAGAWLGSKAAGRNNGVKGALIGAGIGAVARRGFGPLAMLAAGAYGAKKLWDWKKERDAHPTYPSESAPASSASSSPASGARSK